MKCVEMHLAGERDVTCRFAERGLVSSCHHNGMGARGPHRVADEVDGRVLGQDHILQGLALLLKHDEGGGGNAHDEEHRHGHGGHGLCRHPPLSALQPTVMNEHSLPALNL